ncbi:MAG: porin family protein [bacterium]
MTTRLTKYTLLLLLVLLFSGEAVAQRILGALSVGMNLTQVDGDNYYGFRKVGLNIGPQVIVPFGKKKIWSVSMELLYSQKGSHHSGEYDSTTYNLKMDYLEIPVMVHITDKKLISGGVGFSYGQLINYKETQNSFYDSIYTYKTSLNNFDVSVLAEFQIRIWNRLWAGVRYQYSMVRLREVEINEPGVYPKNPETRYQFNNVISIRLTWVFNQEVPGKVKKTSESQQ